VPDRSRSTGAHPWPSPRLRLALLAAGTVIAPLALPPRSASDRLPRRELVGERGRLIDVDGLEVHVVEDGPRDSPAVLLAHHFYGSVATWRRVVPPLATGAHVIAHDRPGFGLTERPVVRRGRPNPYTRAEQARASWHLLDRLGVGTAVLVGSSAGGTHVLEMFAHEPQRVRGLVLLSPAITGDVGAPPALRPLLRTPQARRLAPRIVERIVDDVPRQRVERSWHDPTRLTDEDVEAYRRLVRVEGWARGLWETMIAEPPPDLRELLPRIDVPTVVVAGRSDRTIAPHFNARTTRAIPGARLELLDDCGHLPQEERPDAVVAAVEEVLSAAR
jgi:pimeloyl-ACP methyl ester carboxylesterase